MSDPVEVAIKKEPGASLNELLAEHTMALTPVDGQGIWNAWVRTFEKPEAAFLDLLDNCFDATLHDGFKGKVVLQPLQLEPDIPTEGITMMNNSFKPIKSLEDSLTVYKSSKNASIFQGADVNSVPKEGVIGENGVGLKHGSATLSKVSFIVTRNENMIELGLIAKKLQTSRGPCLPYFSIQLPADFDEGKVSQALDAALDENPVFSAVLTDTLGRDDREKGRKVLLDLIQSTWKDDWKQQDHVFLLILHRLHHMDGKYEVIDVEAPIEPAKEFLDTIKRMLPEHYINLPSDDSFDVLVNKEKIRFNYWPKRLVSLSQFKVNVPTEMAIKDYLSTSDWMEEGQPVKIYCGFDAQRVRQDEKKGGAASCFLYIYSRKAGRMIQRFEDGRQAMNLAASSSVFLQGLTVIIDDRGSSLPLKPTKDGIAWTEQKGGENFKTNLFDYAAGAARLFWNEHEKLMPRKDRLNVFKKVVESYADDQDKVADNNIAAKCMDDANFPEWVVQWKKSKKRKGRKDEIEINRQPFKPVEVQGGSDSVLKLTPERIQEVLDARIDSSAASASASPARSAQASDSTHPVTPETGGMVRGGVNVANIMFGRKRNAGPVDYNGERVIQDLEDGKKKPKKRAKKSTKAKEAKDELEQKLVEMEIKLKEEELKNIQSKKENNELREQLRRSGAAPQASNQSTAPLSQLHAELEKTRAERDSLKAFVDQVRNSKLPANGQTHSGAQADLQRLNAELAAVKAQNHRLLVFEVKYNAMMRTERGKAFQGK